jgi:hypothetical protein
LITTRLKCNADLHGKEKKPEVKGLYVLHNARPMTFHPKGFVVIGSLVLVLSLSTANVRGTGRSVALALEQGQRSV